MAAPVTTICRSAASVALLVLDRRIQIKIPTRGVKKIRIGIRRKEMPPSVPKRKSRIISTTNEMRNVGNNHFGKG